MTQIILITVAMCMGIENERKIRANKGGYRSWRDDDGLITNLSLVSAVRWENIRVIIMGNT